MTLPTHLAFASVPYLSGDRGGIFTLHYARAQEIEPWLDRVAVRGEVIGARYLAIGAGGAARYGFAGMLATVVLSVRVFLGGGGGRAN